METGVIKCEEDLVHAGAYRRRWWRSALYHSLGLLTLGVWWLLGSWWRQARTGFLYEHTDINSADLLVLQERFGDYEEVTIELKALPGRSVSPTLEPQTRLYKFLTYRNKVYWLQQSCFHALSFHLNLPYSEIYSKLGRGLSSKTDYTSRLSCYGPNCIQVTSPSICSLLMTEFSRPFVVFQLACIVMWTCDSYSLYAGVILVMILTSVGSTILDKWEFTGKLQILARSETYARVLRYNEPEAVEVQAEDLVPGDVIELKSSSQVPCDCILLTGTCIVNESLLTGQSVPVLKSPLPEKDTELYEMDKDRKYTLFAGTYLLFVRGHAKAVVVATGFDTLKGQVIKKMMHTSESKAKFYGDALKFIWVFGGVCALATLIAVVSLCHTTASPRDVLFRSLDLISIGIPPALPLTLSLGIALALSRLKDKGIICLSPMAIIAAGKTSLVCFDKTGTLTEETMQFEGTINPGSSVPVKSIGERLATCLACCNSITILNSTPLGAAEDLCLHSVLGYEISESQTERVVSLSGRELKITRIFHFSSHVKRMAVLVSPKNASEYLLYLKGAPEELKPLFRSVPPDYLAVVEQFTQAGYRVLACGCKSLPLGTDPDTQLQVVEKGLQFLGLVLLRNRIKPEAQAIAGKLISVGYRALISTGDNVLTGVSVGLELQLIPGDFDIYHGEVRRSETSVAWTKVKGTGSAYLPDSGKVEWLGRIRKGDTKFALAVSGKAFGCLVTTYKDSNPQLLRFILAQVYVCGRMSPLHKIHLIEELKRLGLVVAMVGDSASDSGSLKAADVGLCVSHLALSLAAPLTGNSILALEDILKEGKATLAASFQCFKFMGLYSMVQLMSVLTLYLLKTNFSTLEFLYVDLFTVIPLTFVIGITKAYPVLTGSQPTGSIFSLSVALSIGGQCCIQMTFIALTYYALTMQRWYVPQGTSMQAPVPITENTVFFLVSNFQYLTACLVYSVGPPFRMPLYTNIWFSGVVLLLFSFNWYLVLAPHPFVLDYLGMVDVPLSFRKVLSVFILLNMLCSILFEYYLSLKSARDLREEFLRMEFQQQSLRSSISY